MVVRVLVEGGVTASNPTLPVQQNQMIQQNSAALRESLNKFFSEVLHNDNVDIRITVGGGWKEAAISFIDNQSNDFLYVDLDRPPEERDEWFYQELYSDGRTFPVEKKDSVFFWVQEMEAWFLKQPECIVKWACQEKLYINDSSALENDNLIKNKDIEHLIQKPSFIMGVIFNRYLVSNKMVNNGKPRKLKYGKLRHAPGLIRCLDPQRMLLQDNELVAFVSKVM